MVRSNHLIFRMNNIYILSASARYARTRVHERPINRSINELKAREKRVRLIIFVQKRSVLLITQPYRAVNGLVPETMTTKYKSCCKNCTGS